MNILIRRVAVAVALFYILASIFANTARGECPTCIKMKPIIVTTMEGFPLKSDLPLKWSLEVVPHHVTVEIDNTPVQLAFQHSGYEVEDFCVTKPRACPPIRATNSGWFLFTHYESGIPFTYRTRQLPNMWRIVPSQWEWLYRSTFHETK
jgi:hypothetical protein